MKDWLNKVQQDASGRPGPYLPRLPIASLVWTLRDAHLGALISDIGALPPVWVGLGVTSILSVYFVQGLRWKSILAPVAKVGSTAGDARGVRRPLHQRNLSRARRGSDPLLSGQPLDETPFLCITCKRSDRAPFRWHPNVGRDPVRVAFRARAAQYRACRRRRGPSFWPVWSYWASLSFVPG